jgi:hypothetical protein
MKKVVILSSFLFFFPLFFFQTKVGHGGYWDVTDVQGTVQVKKADGTWGALAQGVSVKDSTKVRIRGKGSVEFSDYFVLFGYLRSKPIKNEQGDAEFHVEQDRIVAGIDTTTLSYWEILKGSGATITRYEKGRVKTDTTIIDTLQGNIWIDGRLIDTTVVDTIYNMHSGLRSPLAWAYPYLDVSGSDSIGFELMHVPYWGDTTRAGVLTRIINYSWSKYPIAVQSLVGTITYDTLQPGEASMFYADGSHRSAVELAAFDAVVDNKAITLNWKTGSELTNAGFNLYRSTSLDGEYAKLNSELIPTTANAFEGASYSYTDKEVQTGLTYYYKLEDLSIDGLSTFHGPVSAKVSVSVPSNFALAQNYPNPFNASTMISYDLKTDSKVSLKIYNILGQEVTTLVDKYQSAGSYTVTWNSKDSKGNDVSTGVYFYLLKAGDFSANKKMTYLK